MLQFDGLFTEGWTCDLSL